MASFEHESVLTDAVISNLAVRDHGIYVDGTLGGGGHALALLSANPTITLVGIDRDPAALAAARVRLADHASRVHFVHAPYADLPATLASLNFPQVHGILLDLGVSSPQLDIPARGFSFSKPGPLDMRMDPTRGPTALDLLRTLDADSLADILSTLGEERYAHKIARLVKEAVRVDRVHSTTDLATLVTQAIPLIEQRKSKIHPATRTFQALRIAVNAELDQLSSLLAVFPDLLVPTGRLAIISFHSLEDRLVKHRFRDLAWTTSLPRHLAAAAGERTDPVVEVITRKPISASDDEVARNPRARSAHLRVCERTSAPNVPAHL